MPYPQCRESATSPYRKLPNEPTDPSILLITMPNPLRFTAPRPIWPTLPPVNSKITEPTHRPAYLLTNTAPIQSRDQPTPPHIKSACQPTPPWYFELT